MYIIRDGRNGRNLVLNAIQKCNVKYNKCNEIKNNGKRNSISVQYTCTGTGRFLDIMSIVDHDERMKFYEPYLDRL